MFFKRIYRKTRDDASATIVSDEIFKKYFQFLTVQLNKFTVIVNDCNLQPNLIISDILDSF